MQLAPSIANGSPPNMLVTLSTVHIPAGIACFVPSEFFRILPVSGSRFLDLYFSNNGHAEWLSTIIKKTWLGFT
jgi:hypothetical protein